MSGPLIAMSGIVRALSGFGGPNRVLDGVDLTVWPGESVAVLGRSGSGKSTLLSLVALFDQPDAGSYLLDGRDVAGIPDAAAARLRSETFGFVFQRFFLLKHLTAEQNVALPLLNAQEWTSRRTRRERARAALAAVGIEHLARRRPPQLSGGEQQRVAIARALVREPAVILADEPTGALDSVTGDAVLTLLTMLTELGHSLVVVTHDEAHARRMDRIVRIEDGKLVDELAAVTA